jgi:hypothetical protein
MMPLSSIPTVVNTVVFPLNGVSPPAPRPVVVSWAAVTRAATY